MDHNIDFGVNLAQDTMSSSEKREKNFQPGYGGDMRNATQDFLAAELSGGFVQPKNPQGSSVQHILSHETSDFQRNSQPEQPNLYTEHHDNDEFEHDSLNFSPTKTNNENVKFISSTDLLDDFETAKNSLPKTDEIENNFNQFVHEGKNEILANIGNPVNLEFKVEPDNVKLISSDTLLDDFDVLKQTAKPLVPEMMEQTQNPAKSFTSTESIEVGKVSSDSLFDDFGFSKPLSDATKTVEQRHKPSHEFEDAFIESSASFSPAKMASNNEYENDKFISAENFGIEDFNIKKEAESNIAPEPKEQSRNVPKPIASSSRPSSAPTKILKTEPPKANIMQGEVIFHKPGSMAKTNFNVHPVIESLIYWRDIKVSGIVFGVGLIILLALSFFSVISVIAYTSLITLAAAIGFRIYKYVLGIINDKHEGHPFEVYLNEDIEISHERVKQVGNITVSNLNAFVSELKRLFLVEDYVESFKFGVILWILTYIGSWFNGMTLIILAYILAFSLPIAYEQNKQVIDQNMEFARTKVAEINEKIQAVIPFGKTTITEADKKK